MFRKILAISVILFTACGPQVDLEVNTPQGSRTAKVVPEAYLSPWTRPDNIDSPAIWHTPSGEHWVITTAKETDFLVIYDAVSGEEVSRVGGSGAEPGKLKRPNGVMVLGNIALVVERDNHRVQVFSLPEFESLGLIGEQELKKPYGLYAYQLGPDRWRLYVTDDYGTPESESTPDSLLGERVKMFEITHQSGRVSGTYVKSFGQTSGGGVINVAESIWGDPAHDVLMVADEWDNVMEVYDLDGGYKGQAVGDGVFKFQTEGIILVECGRDAGWWMVSDQGDARTIFHIFERRSFSYSGSFAGNVVANTDGIAVTQSSFGPFAGGAFVAVHDDGGIGTFSLSEISDSLGLKLDCEVNH